MLTKYFYIAGCVPFLALGILHTVYTIADKYNPKKLVPCKSGVIELMKESSLAITKETNMWRAWVGFNISHGIGMLFFLGQLFILINFPALFSGKFFIFHLCCANHFIHISCTV